MGLTPTARTNEAKHVRTCKFVTVLCVLDVALSAIRTLCCPACLQDSCTLLVLYAAELRLCLHICLPAKSWGVNIKHTKCSSNTVRTFWRQTLAICPQYLLLVRRCNLNNPAASLTISHSQQLCANRTAVLWAVISRSAQILRFQSSMTCLAHEHGIMATLLPRQAKISR